MEWMSDGKGSHHLTVLPLHAPAGNVKWPDAIPAFNFPLGGSLHACSIFQGNPRRGHDSGELISRELISGELIPRDGGRAADRDGRHA